MEVEKLNIFAKVCVEPTLCGDAHLKCTKTDVRKVVSRNVKRFLEVSSKFSFVLTHELGKTSIIIWLDVFQHQSAFVHISPSH